MTDTSDLRSILQALIDRGAENVGPVLIDRAEKALEAMENMNMDTVSVPTITHEQAKAAAQRLVNGSFRRDGEELPYEQRPHFSIPVRPDHDDDVVLFAYFKQQEALSTAPASPVVGEDAFWRVVYPIIGWEYDVVIKWPESQWEEMAAEDDDGTLADRARERQFAKKIKEALASIPTGTVDDAAVERVARAIHDNAFKYWNARLGISPATFEQVWTDDSDSRKRLESQARAALTAAFPQRREE